MIRAAALQFDRPGLRWVISSLYPFAGRFSRFGTKSLHYQDGWVHEFNGKKVVELQPRLRAAELDDERIKEYCGQLYEPKPDDVIIDVGAGLGWEAIYYSGKVKKVIAIEAHPKLAELLKRSLTLNDISNVEVHSVALVESQREVVIEDDLSQGHRMNTIDAMQGITVQGVPLDDLTEGPIAFIKMNIEGAERLAIQGMNETIRRTKVVAISCHDFRGHESDFYRTKAVVEEWLRGHGFVIVPRHSDKPWFADQLNAYNPRLA